MKKILCTLAMLAGLNVSAQAAGVLIISQIVDGDLTGGLPKAVELTNIGDAALDLDDYAIANANNGGAAFVTRVQLPAVSLPAGSSFVISTENTTFPTVFGFSPGLISGTTNMNGDDVFGLFSYPADVLLDVYGVLGQDGTGQAWEYTDGFAVRGDFGPNPTFTIAEWTVNLTGLDTLDLTGHRNAIGDLASGTNQVGSHSHTTLPVEVSGYEID